MYYFGLKEKILVVYVTLADYRKPQEHPRHHVDERVHAEDIYGYALQQIHPARQEQPLNLAFSNIKVPASLKAYRTSASENMQQAGDVTVNHNKAAFRMMSQSIVTFSGKIR